MSKTKKTVIGLVIGAAALTALNLVAPVTLRYASAGTGFVLSALGAQDPRQAEDNFRAEIADQHDSPLTFVRNAFGDVPADVAVETAPARALAGGR